MKEEALHYYERLRDAREDCDLSQSDVAKALGTSQTQISRHEQGKHRLSAEDLKAYCMLYGVSSDYILDLPANLSKPRQKK